MATAVSARFSVWFAETSAVRRHSLAAAEKLSALSSIVTIGRILLRLGLNKLEPSLGGAELFVRPPYSLDLNPIEQVFAKLKTPRRKAAERSVAATSRRIGALLYYFTAAECANHIRNAGCASAKTNVL